MIQINKTIAPIEFNKDLASGATIYPNHLSKEGWSSLRKKLLEDQGYICCYCQRRIPHKNSKKSIVNPKSKIEHFKCQESNPHLQLKFNNLFIACNGNYLSSNITCDSKKGEKNLKKVNFFTTIQDEIYYTKNGQIRSKNPELQNDIDDVLNLNDENLMIYRKHVYDAIFSLKKKLGKSKNYIAELNQVKKNIQMKKVNGYFEEFLGVKLYFLNK